MSVEWASFIKNKSAEKTEAEIMLGDSINNFKTIQSFGYESKIVDQYALLLEPMRKDGQKQACCNAIIVGFSNCLLTAQQAVLNIYLVELIQRNLIKDPTKAFKVVNVILNMTQELSSKLFSIGEIAKGLAAFEVMNGMLDRPSYIDAIEMDEKKEGDDVSTVKGRIEFRDVWFRYPTRKEEFVLKGLTLTIEPGESVALVGESGCGKSTFINLMMRFYDPQFGEILLDGKSLKSYNLHELRSALSLVMQEPVLFNYSIAENIIYGAKNMNAVTNAQIAEMAEAANCTHFVHSQKERENVDESPKALITRWEANKDEIIRMLQTSNDIDKEGNPVQKSSDYGEKKYQEELEYL